MSGAAAARALDLAGQILNIWDKARALAAEGDREAVTLAMQEAEGLLEQLMDGPLQAQADGGRALLEQLLEHGRTAIARVERAMSQLGEELQVLSRQRLEVRAAQRAMQRFVPQPRWVDEKG